MDSRTAPTGANTLHLVHRQGDGGPPLVFIPGFGGDTTGWAPLLAALKNTHPLVLLDLPSHGKSPLLEVNDVHGIAAHVQRSLEDAGATDAHIVGHSLGGAVAIAIAGAGRIRVSSLCLLAPAGLGDEVNGDFINGYARADDALALTPWLQMLVHDPGLITSDLAEFAMLGRADPALRKAQQEMASLLFRVDRQKTSLRDVLADLRVPQKIIWGLEDRIIPWRHAMGLGGRAGLHLLPGVGHVPQFEAINLVAGLIDELVRSAGQ